MHGRLLLFLISFALCAVATIAQSQLRGHGGPVRAVAVSPDGRTILSGSFDTSAIQWSLAANTAERVLRFHSDAVNAVVFLKDGRFATAGADAKIAIWSADKTEPEQALEGHTAPIVALAVSPDGASLASASWDHSVRVWPLAGGTPRVLEGHTQNVNGVAFTPDGSALVSASYDLTVRVWPLDNAALSAIMTLPTPLNTVVVASDGEILVGGADGKLYFLDRDGNPSGDIDAQQSPVIALAVSPDGAWVAAAGIRGSVAIIDRKARAVARTLVGPGLPVWSAAFMPDNRTLVTGGTDRLVRRWDTATGEHLGGVATGATEDPLAAFAGDRGAEIYRACVACHTLRPDEGSRAGPTLAGIFGRRIATLPGYNFSPALRGLDIVWSPETVSKLFEVGPATYAPGTKMPEQTIGSPDDRKALMDFLARATRQP
jgi:cytochrome c